MTREELLESICPTAETYSCNIDKEASCIYCNELMNRFLDEYDKRIKAEFTEEILNKVNSYIADMKKYFSETQDETFLCAISETQKVRNIIRDMLKEQK